MNKSLGQKPYEFKGQIPLEPHREIRNGSGHRYVRSEE